MKRNVSNAKSDWQRRCESEGYVDPPERLAVASEDFERFAASFQLTEEHR